MLIRWCGRAMRRERPRDGKLPAQTATVKLIIQNPCLSEEMTQPETVRDLPRSVDGFDPVKHLDIDDGSTDRTIEVAREPGSHAFKIHRTKPEPAHDLPDP